MGLEPLLVVVLILVAAGILLYLINTYITIIDPKINLIINVVVVIAAILISIYFLWTGTAPLSHTGYPRRG
jgi:hypothetical protein